MNRQNSGGFNTHVVTGPVATGVFFPKPLFPAWLDFVNPFFVACAQGEHCKAVNKLEFNKEDINQVLEKDSPSLN